MVDSLYYSSRKISERCENSFLDYRINYQKLCYLMRQITKDLNWPSESVRFDLHTDSVPGEAMYFVARIMKSYIDKGIIY